MSCRNVLAKNRLTYHIKTRKIRKNSMLKKVIFLVLCIFIWLPTLGMEHVQKNQSEDLHLISLKSSEDNQFPGLLNATQLKLIFGFKDGKSELDTPPVRVTIGKTNYLYKGSLQDHQRMIRHLATCVDISAFSDSENYSGSATTMGIGYQGSISNYLLFLGGQPAQKPKMYHVLWTKEDSADLKDLDDSKLAIFHTRSSNGNFLMCSAKGKPTKVIESYKPNQDEVFQQRKLPQPIYDQILKRLKDVGSLQDDDEKDKLDNRIIEWAFNNDIAEKTDFIFQLSISEEKAAPVKSKSEGNEKNKKFIIKKISTDMRKEALEILIFVYPTVIDPINLFEELIDAVKSDKDNAGPIREFLMNLNMAYTRFATGGKNLMPFKAQLQQLDTLVRLPPMFFTTRNFTLPLHDQPLSTQKESTNNPFYRDLQREVEEPFRSAKLLLNAENFFQEISPEGLGDALKVRTIELYNEFTLSDIVTSSRNLPLDKGKGELMRYSDGVANLVKYIIRAGQNDEIKKERTNTLFKIGLQYLHSGDFHLAYLFYVSIEYLDAHKYIPLSAWFSLCNPMIERVADVFRPKDTRPYLPRLNHITAKLQRLEGELSSIANEEEFIQNWGPVAEFFKDYLSLKVLNQPTPICSNNKALEFVRTLTYFDSNVYNDFIQEKLNNDIKIIRRPSGGPVQEQKEIGSAVRKISSSKEKDKETHKKNKQKDNKAKFHKDKDKK
jgi:hypothetical protein